MQVIYVDTLFVLNTAADLLCLIAAERVCDRRVGWFRLGFAASIGGIYAVLGVLPGLGFLRRPLIYPVCAMGMTLAAFGKGAVLRPFAAVLAAGMMLGGAVYGVSLFLDIQNLFSAGGALRVFLIAMGVSWAAFTLAFRRMGRQKHGGGLCRVEVQRQGRCAAFTALRDTGNSLRDPLTGSRILVCELSAILPLFTPNEQQLLQAHAGKPVELMQYVEQGGCLTKFRITPYRAVGVPAGMLAVFPPDTMKMDGKEVQKPLIAISPSPVSDSGAYSALASAERV